MFKAQCYICAKPGKLEKLFRNCNHESACYDCLRDRYVTQAQHVSSYPLKCFHPECDRAVCHPQIKRFARSEQELRNFRGLTQMQKVLVKLHTLNAQKQAATYAAEQEARLGTKNWPEIKEALGEIFSEDEIRCCPSCKMVITKNGGCVMVRCICGHEFSWQESIKQIQKQVETSCSEINKSFQPLQEKLDRLVQFYNGMIQPVRSSASRAPRLRIEKEAEFVDDDSLQDHDFFDDNSCGLYNEIPILCESETKEEDYSVLSELDTASFPSISLVEAATIVTADLQRTDWEQEDFDALKLTSDQLDDSWSQFDCSESNGDFPASSSTTTAWEEISEVSSVVSLHSKTGMSFLEAARLASKQTFNNKWKEVSKVPMPMSQPLETIVEQRKQVVSDHDQVDEMFDADFMLDGVKCSRGGKYKFRRKMFV